MPTPMLYNRAQKAQEQARKERIRQEVITNLKHNVPEGNVDIYVLSVEELHQLWIAKQKRKGKSDSEIDALYQTLTGEHFELTKTHAANVVGLVGDSKNIAALMRDMKRSGNTMGKYWTKNVDGRKYIVFKGNHKLRKVIKGTVYSAKNPTIVRMGIGVDGAKNSAKMNVWVTMIISYSLNSYHWIFDPKFGWSEYLKNVSSDAVKVILATLSGYFVHVAASSYFSAAVVPLALGGFVVFAVGVGLILLDHDGRITDAVSEAIVQEVIDTLILLQDPSGYAQWKVDKLGRKAAKAREEAGRHAYHIISETGNVIIESVSDAVEEEARRVFRRIFKYDPKLVY